jgi:hypothetical protein
LSINCIIQKLIYFAYHIRQRAKDYQLSVVAVSQDARQVNREARLIGWKPPVGDWIKLNTDGACKDGNVAGCGGILRNNAGEWRGGFAKHLGKCSAYVAELWGVVEGMRYAHQLGFRKIQLSVDSAAVVQVLANGTSKSMMGTSLVKQIKMMLEQEWSVEISHS